MMGEGDGPPIKKHKKHKKDKDKDREKYGLDMPGAMASPRLKLILKVGSSTPEHSDSPGPSISYSSLVNEGGEDSQHSTLSVSYSHIKKAKKKEKKKKKDKKHKHHKEKRRKEREEMFRIEEYVPPPLDTGGLRFADMSDTKVFPIHEVPMDDGNTSFTAVGFSGEARECVIKQRLENKPLTKLLEHLYRTLEKKDPQQFFAWPVTDKIAPGYSSIIKNPMDFTTMRRKLDDGEYESLVQFSDDFRLMCENAMTYNHQETVYYKAAKKLLQGGMKILSPDKIRYLLPLIPSIQSLSEETLGFSLLPEAIPQEGVLEAPSMEEESQDFVTLDPMKSEHFVPPNPFDPPDLTGAFSDDFTTQEILQQARLAAREAGHRLALKKPNSKLGFLRQRDDGSTSLMMLVPSQGVSPGSKEQPISLGALSGKLAQGTVQLHGVREIAKNTHRAMKPLSYGAFSSYAPSKDTTFSNLTDEEAELVRSTYGEQSNVQYAESMIEFAKGCDYALQMVDEILNTLTRGEHSKTVNLVEERKKLLEEESRIHNVREELHSEWNFVESMGLSAAEEPTVQSAPGAVNLDSLKSLGELGIDVSFLEDPQFQNKYSITKKLEENTRFISALEKLQSDRLKRPTVPVPPYCHPISKEELELADRVAENLIDLAQKANPENIASVEVLRKAMGVTADIKPAVSPPEAIAAEQFQSLAAVLPGPAE